MNIVLQQYDINYYNVWEDIDLKKTNERNDGLIGEYLVHSLNTQYKRDLKQSCNWTYDDLYIIKNIYGGFLEFLKE